MAAFAVRGASPGTNPFTNAVSYFNPDSAVATSYALEANVADPGLGFKAAFLWYEFCWPPTSGQIVADVAGTFTIAPDGTLTGNCESTTPGGAAHRESTLDGIYDLRAQTAQFTFEGSQTSVANPAVARLSVEAPATDVAGDRAEGTAPFVYTCTPGADSDQPCGFTRIEGTVMFAIQFQPTLPTEPTSTAQPLTPTGATATVATLSGMQVSLTCSSTEATGGLSTLNCSAAVTGAPAGAILAYAWKLRGVQLSETGSTMSASALTPATYQVDVLVSDSSPSAAGASGSEFVEVGKGAGSGGDDNSLVVIIILLILAGVGAAALVAIIRALRGRPKVQT
ncbi:MAG: hypothetical protein QFC55_04555 [Chloroflexota bacterium]|nr:hypothetical protein [Chloroflexota bacterium]